MTQPRVGWSVDTLLERNNVNKIKVPKTLLIMALAISDLVKLKEPVPQRQWKTFCDELHAHMSNMSAEKFLDGFDGEYAIKLQEALFSFDDNIEDDFGSFDEDGFTSFDEDDLLEDELKDLENELEKEADENLKDLINEAKENSQESEKVE